MKMKQLDMEELKNSKYKISQWLTWHLMMEYAIHPDEYYIDLGYVKLYSQFYLVNKEGKYIKLYGKEQSRKPKVPTELVLRCMKDDYPDGYKLLDDNPDKI